MKDIDFDELDRAVNSLQAAPTGATPATAAPAPDGVPITVNVSKPAPAPLAERRSSGRFMDVVHPSSDMRSSTPLVTTNTPVAETPQPVAVPESVTPSPTVTDTNMPDPIDFHPFTPGAMASAGPAPKAEDPDIAKIANEITNSLSSEPAAPLDSPFLPGAQVEKRPLGAFSTDMHTSPLNVSASPAPSAPIESAPEPVVTPEPTSDDLPIENDTPLPAELQNNLLSIEGDEGSDVSSPESQFMAPNAPSTDVPVGPTSIPQQYTEQPSTGDQPTSTIFDTEAYKKPAVTAKKKSSWMIIVWILALLVAGAGIGAAVYFFVLPHL